MKTPVSLPIKLRLITTLLWVTIIVALLLTLAIALGWANPPVPPEILWKQSSPSSLPIVNNSLENSTNTITFAGVPFPTTLPITLQASADFNGQMAVWGFWLTVDDVPQYFLLHPDGYVSTHRETQPDWSQFIHIRPALNHLSLSLTPSGGATLRINHEIAWTGNFSPNAPLHGGIVFDRFTPPQWVNIQLNGD